MELFEKLEIEMKARRFSQKTIKAYSFHISEFLKTAGLEHATITDDRIKAYSCGLLDKSDPRTVSLAIASIKFLYILTQRTLNMTERLKFQ